VVAITHPEAQGEPSIPTDAETEQHLLEIVPAIFAVPIGWPGRSGYPWFVLIGPIERNRRGVLMQLFVNDGTQN
jgi:hypothetical protein